MSSCYTLQVSAWCSEGRCESVPTKKRTAREVYSKRSLCLFEIEHSLLVLNFSCYYHAKCSYNNIKIGKHFVIHLHHSHLVQLTNTSPTNTLLMLLCTTKNEFGYILKCAYLRARPFCFLLFAMNTTKLSNPNMTKSLD